MVFNILSIFAVYVRLADWIRRRSAKSIKGVRFSHWTQDSNRKNNTKENLVPLCPNHHAMFDRGIETDEMKRCIMRGCS